MAGDQEPTPLERSLVLVRYFLEQNRPITLEELGADLPEYAAEKANTAATVLRRDRDVLRDEARIDISWNEDAQAYVMPRPFFTPNERRALVEAARTVAIDGVTDDGDTHAIGAAVDGRSAVVAVRVPAIMEAIQPHVGARQIVQFTYNGSLRTVQPWRIGQWRDDWYLVALEVDGTKPKRFALDRILPAGDDDDVIATVGAPGAFMVPDDVDWDEQFCLDPNSWGPDPELAVRIRIADALRPLLDDAFDGWTAVSRDGDDLEVEILARHHESTIIRLLSFGSHLTVLGPDAFVAQMRIWLAPQAEVD